jgi:hypothetical protein
MVEPAHTLAISNLRAQIFLGKMEEKRLRTILADAPIFKVKLQTQFDLNRLRRNAQTQSDELARLLAKE